MDKLLGSVVGSELFFVYGLIALVVVLIIVIVIIDRRESKKKPKNLFDTLNMKIIANPDDYTADGQLKEKEELTPDVDVIEVKQQVQETNFEDLQPIPEVKTIASSNNEQSTFEHKETLTETIANIEEEVYTESDLEKTQAQIRVEEISEALKKAQVEEQIQEDKYTKFEEEQEKNAIISYNELKESFDRLYSENEKIQYLEDDEIPINIDELYELNNQKEEKKINELPKVKLDDFSDFAKTQPAPQTNSTFKSSPLISPVYGIQQPPVEVKTTVDTDIQNANQFLQSLKELKNNLD